MDGQADLGIHCKHMPEDPFSHGTVQNEFNPCRGLQHSFVEIDREIFSMVILSLPLIQEGQLSVSGTILVIRLEDLSLPSKRVVR